MSDNTKKMEAVMPGVDHETQQIISTYQKLYNLIFGYGSFIVIGILSFVVVLMLNSSGLSSGQDISPLNNQLTPASSLIQSGDTYIAKGITLSPDIYTKPLNVSILQGFVSISAEAQMGYGALASHGDIILPISINLTAHEENFSKAVFGSGYDPALLDSLIQNTILTYPVKNIQTTLYQYRQRTMQENARNANNALGQGMEQDITTAVLPNDEPKSTPANMTLTSRFGLQCLGNRQITNFFCYKNAETFIARVPYLSFDNKLEELGDIFSELVKTPYKEIACSNLQYGFSRNPVASREWEMIFMSCGQKYTQSYQRIVDFSTVNYELQGISNAKLYADDDINIFKLLSLQQKIYHNTLQKNYDVGTIEVYLAFVQDLLTKRPNIDPLYKDIIYLYNNTHLQSSLTQIAILNNNTKAMLRLTDVVRNINEGTIQLQRAVSNPSLLTFVDENKNSGTSQPDLITFQDLFANKFTTFGNFIVTSQKVNNDTLSAQVEGYFSLNEDGSDKKVLFVGDYVFSNENFTLTYASFPQSPYLETALNKLIKEQNIEIDIPFVYEFIKNNNDYASTSVSICDLIRTRTSPTECSDAAAIVDADGIRIKLTFDGYRLTSLNTTNDKMTAQLRESLAGVITTQSNISSVVADLVKLAREGNMPPTDSETLTGSTVDTNQFTILSKFKQYFDTTPTSINLNGGKYIVEFTFANIDFVAAVDIANNYKLFPIAIQQGEQIIRVNNLSLNLTNVGLTDINQFKADPWAYIKRLDSATYEITHKED